MIFCGAVGDTWAAQNLKLIKTSAIVPGTFSTQPSWLFVQKQPVIASTDPNAVQWDYVQARSCATRLSLGEQIHY
jgi:hypothetical protein